MRNSALYTYFFLLFLPAVATESGSGGAAGYDTCTDDEIDTSFVCVTQMLVHSKTYLICNPTRGEMYPKEANVAFTVSRGGFLECRMETPWVSNCSLEPKHMISSLNVCLVMTLMKQQCKECQQVSPNNIVKPEAPFGLKITYEENANEYRIEFSTLYVEESFLSEKLMHQLAYRQESTSYWTTREYEYIPIKLLGKEFQPGATYEMKVRSSPKGGYFTGTWSEWSSSEYRTITNDYTIITMTASIVAFLLLFILISLILVFWKNRIKPIVWPTIPKHEKTLDKFCHKLRKNSDASFFNPENLEYVHIHKVDSIQAKTEMDHFNPSSFLAVDVPWMLGYGLEQKPSLSHINHGWLKLPLLYEGMKPNELLTKHLSRRNHLPAGDTSIGAMERDENANSSSGGQHGGMDDVRSCSTASVDSTILYKLQEDPCHQSYANSETRMLNIEEAYVTMASFSENRDKS